MKSLARKGEIGDPSLQGVRLDPMTSGIGGDANTTKLSPAAHKIRNISTQSFALS